MNGPRGEAAAPRTRAALIRQMIVGGGLGRFLGALGPTAVALGVQFVAFAVTARGLGVRAFGEYAVLLGLTGIGLELIGLGGTDLLVRAVSRDRSRLPAYYGNMLLLIALTIVPVTLIGLVVARLQLETPIPLGHVAMALVGEMVIGRASASIELVMVAHGDTFRASLIRLTTAAVRLLVALAYFGLAGGGLDGWIVAVFVQSLLLTAGYVALAARLYGRPRLALLTGELRAGAAFGVNQTARAAQGNLDRVLLAPFADAAVLGAYAAGSRILQVGLFPLQVLTRILYPQFFVAGEGGIAGSRRFALAKLPVMLATGIGAAILVAAAGLLAPGLLGHDFARTSQTALFLSGSLPLMALQYLAADALTGAGFQHIRAMIYGGSAVGFGLLLAGGALIGGVNGLIAAYLLAHAVLAGVLWATMFRIGRRG